MLTIRNHAENFFSYCSYEKGLSAKTLKAYQIDLRQFESFIEQNFGTSSIGTIDKQILREYIKKLSHGFKPRSIKRKMATIKAFFNYLEFEEIVRINPFRHLRIAIKEGKQLPKTIALSKIIKLFKYLYGAKERTRSNPCYFHKAIVRDIAVLELLFSSGMRVAELCDLKKENIDFIKGSLKIVGKGNKERLIPICNRETMNAITAYYELFETEILRRGYFFVNRLRNRLSEQSVRYMIKKYSKAIHFNVNITPHMFRHSIATLLLERGVDIRYIQTFLGHSSIITTQIYVQVNEAAQRAVLLKKHPRRFFMSNEG